MTPTSSTDVAGNTWDITKLCGPERGCTTTRYVGLDIFSACEDSEIAKTMLEQAMGVHGIPEAIHADGGAQ